MPYCYCCNVDVPIGQKACVLGSPFQCHISGEDSMWRLIEMVPDHWRDGVKEIVALSPAYVGKDGKPGVIVLRWFKYNGSEAWRDWDADAHFPTHFHPLADLTPIESK